MKLSALYKLCKRTKYVTIINGVNGRQWINVDGGSTYPLDGMPYIDEETLLTMMDVAEDDRAKWHINIHAHDEYMRMFTEDNLEGDIEAKAAEVTIGHMDEVYRPIYSRHGMLMVNVDAFAPVADTARTHELFVRMIRNQPVLLVKNGFQLVATICRVKFSPDPVAQELQDIANHIVMDAARTKDEENEHDGDQATL